MYTIRITSIYGVFRQLILTDSPAVSQFSTVFNTNDMVYCGTTYIYATCSRAYSYIYVITDEAIAFRRFVGIFYIRRRITYNGKPSCLLRAETSTRCDLLFCPPPPRPVRSSPWGRHIVNGSIAKRAKNK